MENSIKHTYLIDEMSCGGRVTTVKNKSSAAHRVTSVSVDPEKKEAEITSPAIITEDTLQGALKNMHYTISELSAV